MTAPKLTPWIKGDPLEDRPGWYEVRVQMFSEYGPIAGKFSGPFFCWWDGQSHRTAPDGATQSIHSDWGDQFRGLTAPAIA